MGKKEQDQGESSKVATRRSKRQRLAALVAFRALEDKTSGVRINEKRNKVEVAQTLQSLNTVRRSPRKQTEIQHPPDEIQPPSVVPGPNSIPSPNITPINPNSADTFNAMNSDFSDEDYQPEPVKKKRGKTMMKKYSLTPNEKAEVEFNELGQPIGINSNHLSSYLGTLAREMVPMTISEWKKVDQHLKDDLWICIQTRFKVDAIYKDLLFQMLRVRWKESKSRLVSAIKAMSTCPDSYYRLIMLKPDNIKTVQEWNDFVQEKLSEKFELTSNKYRAIREKNKIPHTMGRKGYARLAEDMKKGSGTSDISRDDLWCTAHTRKNGDPLNSIVSDYIAKIKEHSNNTTSSQGTTSISEDGVSKVFGKERRGRVRGLGFGIVPSQMGIHLSNSKKVCALENQVNSLAARVEELSKLFSTSVNGKQIDNAADPEIPRAHTPQSHRDSNNMQIEDHQNNKSPESLVKRKCKLLGWEKNVVAEGTIASINPNTLVHFVKLGQDVWKVWVNAAVDPESFLFRPNSEMYTIKEAVGTTVAWHKDFILLD